MSFGWKTQDECTKLSRTWRMSLDECKEACRKEQGCNVIIHDSKKRFCEVGSCTIPIDSAPWIAGSIRGYYLTGG